MDVVQSIVSFKYERGRTSFLVIDGYGSFQLDQFESTEFPFDNEGTLLYERDEPEQCVYGPKWDRKMSDDQIAKVREFAGTLPEFLEMPFTAYDPERDNIYVGEMSIKEARNAGYVCTAAQLDHPASKFDVTKSAWTRVKAVITDEGALVLDPSGFCDRCVLFMDEAEWSVFPHPDEELISMGVLRYNFSTSTWDDTRNSTDLLDSLRMKIHSECEMKLMRKVQESEVSCYVWNYNTEILRQLRRMAEVSGSEFRGANELDDLDNFEKALNLFRVRAINKVEDLRALDESQVTKESIAALETAIIAELESFAK